MPIKRTITKAHRSAPTQGIVEERVDLFVHDGRVHGRPVLEFGRVVMAPYPRADRDVEPTFEVVSINARGTTRLRVFHAPPPPSLFESLSTHRPLDLWTDDTTLSMTLRGVKKDTRAHVERLLMPGYRTLYVNGVQFRQQALRAAFEEGVVRGSPVTIEADPTNEYDAAALKVIVGDHFVDHFVGHIPRGLTGVVDVGTCPNAEVLRLAQWPGPAGQPNTRPFYVKIKVREAATDAATE